MDFNSQVVARVDALEKLIERYNAGEMPVAASQAEVDAGTNTRKIVTPATLAGAALDTTKVSKLWESDGGAVAWATNATGDLLGDGDVYPDGSVVGLKDKLIDQSFAYDYHYSNAAEANDLAWAAYLSGAPTVAVQNDVLRPYSDSAAKRHFGYIVLPASGTFYVRTKLYKRRIGGLNAGVRVDDGTENNYFELYLTDNTTYSGLSMVETQYRSGGGFPVTTSYPNLFVRPEYVWLAIFVNITAGTVAPYFGIQPFQLLDGIAAAVSLTPTNGGVYFTGSVASNYIVAYDLLRTQGL